MSHSLLELRRITKRFGATVALEDVNFTLRSGEVHALIGENGAGKSTLMKIVAGVYLPDHAEMALADPNPSIADRPRMFPYHPANPAEARDQGISMIYQERNLAPDLSVEANIMLGLEPVDGIGFIQKKRLRNRVKEALWTLGHKDIDPLTPVHLLGPGKRQVVEIARALVVKARVVVLDEPTSSLSPPDVTQLFETIRRLRDQGIGVIYISHFLEEILEIADYYTVLRDGQVVDSGGAAEADLTALIRVMTGRTLGTLFPCVPHEIGGPVLELEGLTGRRMPKGAVLRVHKGEILGLFGLVGSGRTELLRALYGLDPIVEGRVTVRGVSDQGQPPYVRRDQAFGLLSEDRQAEGLALNQSVADNMTYGHVQAFSTMGYLSRSRQWERVRTWIGKLGIRATDPGQSMETLSGGNQQKVAMARLLHWEADIILLDEPTRGIDVTSKATIYRLIGELAAQGKAILFVSSYLPELIGVSDRLCVMYRGRLSEPLETQSLEAHQVMSLATTGENHQKEPPGENLNLMRSE